MRSLFLWRIYCAMGKNSDFFQLPPELMAALGTVLGFALIGDLTSAQQNSLGNFLMLIAQVIETTSAQKQVLEAQNANQQINQIQAQINLLKQQMSALTSQMGLPQAE